MGVKTFGLDQGQTLEAKAGVAGVFGGLRLRSLVEGALLGSSRCGEDEEFAIGEDAVDVEQEEFDFAGAKGGRVWFWHGIQLY